MRQTAYGLTVEHGGQRFENATPDFLATMGVRPSLIAAAQVDAARSAAIAAIDQLAGRLRAPLISAGADQAAVYRMKAEQARAWRRSNTDDRAKLENFPLLGPEAEARGLAIEELVSEVLAADHAFAVAVGRIEAARVAGKQTVWAAETLPDITRAAEAAEAALNSLSEEL